jgi:hypothetical protein
MSQDNTTDTDTNKRKPTNIEDTGSHQIKKLKEWYNGKLQEIINLSGDIGEEDLEE